MKNLYGARFLLVFLLFSGYLPGQQSKTDSLISLVNTLKADSHKVDVLNDISWAIRATGNFYAAKPYADSAQKLAEKINYPKGLGKAHSILGVLNVEQGNYPEGLEQHFKALKIREKLNDLPGVSTSYLNIGEVYRLQRDYPRALENYNTSLKIKEKTGDRKGIGNCYNNIGNIYYLQKQFEKALENYTVSLKIRESLGDGSGIMTSYNNIGNVFFSQEKYTEAQASYQEVLKLSEELEDVMGIISATANIGNTYFKLKKYTEANACYEKSLALAKETGSKEDILQAYISMTVVDSLRGNYQSAFSNYKQYVIYRDSLFNEEKASDIVRMQMTYDSDKKEAMLKADQEKERAVAEERDRRQMLVIWIGAAGLLLVIVFAIFMYNRFRVTREQKLVIEAQKKETDRQKLVIEEKNKDITDSIRYAQRLQQAILPPEKLWMQQLPQSFIFYKPKDIVAGDFYFMEATGDLVFFAAADCTGHGVPGAMVSVVCSNALNGAVKEFGLLEPGKILDKVTQLVLETFRKSENEVKDGMDISFCCLDKRTNTLTWAGANNPLWYLQAGEMLELKADKQPIGSFENPQPFTTHTVRLNPGDLVYIFTDGYADQFGGPDGKKFKYKPMKELLMSMSGQEPYRQHALLAETFDKWKGNLEQVDDVLVIGIRI
ncbi:MAG: protein serine/threonine phosphatase [Bacteroidetes bacterium]|nr:MAG: protein serine/threonine phosphatase [Bacteroidota bacterium]